MQATGTMVCSYTIIRGHSINFLPDTHQRPLFSRLSMLISDCTILYYDAAVCLQITPGRFATEGPKRGVLNKS